MYRFTLLRAVDGRGVDTSSVKGIDLWWLAAAAAEEFLQGSPMAPAFVGLFQAQLVAGNRWLRWAGDLAESAEMRRALSGLYGRIAARALLTHRLGFTDFVSLQRNVTGYGRYTVRRNSTRKRGKDVYVAGDIPDWIALDPRSMRLVLGEAKGALTGSPGQFANDQPACVSQGKDQFDRVTVTRGRARVATRNWVAANLWSTERRQRTPVSLLYDPPAEGDEIPEDEWPAVIAEARNEWVSSLLPGFGIAASDDPASAMQAAYSVMVEAEPSEADAVNVDPPRGGGGIRPRISGSQDTSPLVLEDTRRSTQGHRGRYVTGLVTQTGMSFIRTATELAIAQARVKEERSRDRGALIVGLAVDSGKRTGMKGGSDWIAGAGMARHDGFAIFDATQVRLSADPDGGVADRLT